MKIENRLETAKLKNYYMLMLGVMFSLGVYYLFERQASIFYLVGVFVVALVYLFFLLRRSDYFYLNFDGRKVTVRYYTAHPFLRKYKAFEIPKAYLKDYEIKSVLGGYRKFILFTVKTPKGVFKYPPVSISLLTKKQESELFEILKKIKS